MCKTRHRMQNRPQLVIDQQEAPLRWTTRKTKVSAFLLAVVLSVLFTTHVIANGAGDVPYPTGTSAHVKTTLVSPQRSFFQTSGGIHHIYAHEKGMEGYITRKFPERSILVFDLLGTKEKDGATGEGPRQRVDVMPKVSKRFSLTGGWGLERFLGDSETDRPLT